MRKEVLREKGEKEGEDREVDIKGWGWGREGLERGGRS